MPSPEIPAADADSHVDDDPSAFVRRSQSEFRLLETGEFSDFTIACGDREWKVHKAILSKVPYFNATVGGGFKVHTQPSSLHKDSDVVETEAATILQETVEEKITIEEFFEPFEIQWLLSYIYFPHAPSLTIGVKAHPAPSETDFDPESARLDTASKSYLETCVRLWQLGDYFQVESMTKLAKDKLSGRCERWRQCSGTVDTATHGTTFIVDLESAIRQAWREDLASGPLRAVLAGLFIDFAPYVRRYYTFFTLMQEVPQFAVTFSQRALGSIPSSLPLPNPNSVLGLNALPSTDSHPVDSSVTLGCAKSGPGVGLVTPGSTRAPQRTRSPPTARRLPSRVSVAHLSRPRPSEASD